MAEIRLRNTSTNVVFPLLSADTFQPYYTSAWGSLTSASVIAYCWSDSVSAFSHSITSTPNRLGNSGLWQLSLSTSEMNPSSSASYMAITFDADEIESQTLLIDLKDNDIYSTSTSIKSKTDLLTFSGSNLNARVVDKGILNDITVANILAGTVDTITVEDILEILLAFTSGRITVSGTTYTYYSQNNTSSLFSLTGSTSERTRS
jgi:hypothetical protein